MKLMYSPTSPFVRRVHVVALELDLAARIEFEPVQVTPLHANDAYAEQVNPLRKIPALVLDDGETVLVDSAVIVQYLDELAGGARLIPTGANRWRVLSQQAIAQGMSDAVVLVRYETWLRPQALRWQDWINDQLGRFWSGLAWFERHAQQALPPARIDVSQIALACCLGHVDFRFPELGWPARAPLVHRWYREIVQRPSLAQTDPQSRG